MNKLRFPRLAALAAKLFEQPISNNYLLLALLFIVAGCAIVYSDTRLSNLGKHLVMVATMLGIARLFNPTPLRWVWVSIVCTISLALMLDVAVFLI